MLTDDVLRRKMQVYGCEDFAVVQYETNEQYLSLDDQSSCDGSEAGSVFRMRDEA
jgi:hypothetical protein